jgi:hypothetical protein
MARPFDSTCTVRIEAAVTAGCRVKEFVTPGRSNSFDVTDAAKARAT